MFARSHVQKFTYSNDLFPRIIHLSLLIFTCLPTASGHWIKILEQTAEVSMPQKCDWIWLQGILEETDANARWSPGCRGYTGSFWVRKLIVGMISPTKSISGSDCVYCAWTFEAEHLESLIAGCEKAEKDYLEYLSRANLKWFWFWFQGQWFSLWLCSVPDLPVRDGTLPEIAKQQISNVLIGLQQISEDSLYLFRVM